jgi:hypothetical protein
VRKAQGKGIISQAMFMPPYRSRTAGHGTQATGAVFLLNVCLRAALRPARYERSKARVRG